MIIFLTSFFSTPLHLAIVNGNDVVFDVLIANKANLEIRTNEGYPALYYALRQKNMHYANLLVQKGASMNTVRRFSFTIPTPLKLSFLKQFS